MKQAISPLDFIINTLTLIGTTQNASISAPYRDWDGMLNLYKIILASGMNATTVGSGERGYDISNRKLENLNLTSLTYRNPPGRLEIAYFSNFEFNHIDLSQSLLVNITTNFVQFNAVTFSNSQIMIKDYTDLKHCCTVYDNCIFDSISGNLYWYRDQHTYEMPMIKNSYFSGVLKDFTFLEIAGSTLEQLRMGNVHIKTLRRSALNSVDMAPVWIDATLECTFDRITPHTASLFSVYNSTFTDSQFRQTFFGDRVVSYNGQSGYLMHNKFYGVTTLTSGAETHFDGHLYNNEFYRCQLSNAIFSGVFANRDGNQNMSDTHYTYIDSETDLNGTRFTNIDLGGLRLFRDNNKQSFFACNITDGLKKAGALLNDNTNSNASFIECYQTVLYLAAGVGAFCLLCFVLAGINDLLEGRKKNKTLAAQDVETASKTEPHEMTRLLKN